MDSWGPLLKRQGIFHKANVPNNDILPRYLSRDTILPALNRGRVKFLHVVLQKQKTKCQSFLQNTNCFSYAIPKYTIIRQKTFSFIPKAHIWKRLHVHVVCSKKHISPKLMQCQSVALQRGKPTKRGQMRKQSPKSWLTDLIRSLLKDFSSLAAVYKRPMVRQNKDRLKDSLTLRLWK